MENESLSIASEMLRTRDFLHKRVYFLNAFIQDPMIKDNPQPPLIAYQILLSWKFLGENLWGPRLFNVFLGILAVLLMYLVSRYLFNSSLLALFSAFCLSIMPLAVFFSRNLQADIPAFSFMLLSHLFYLRYIFNFKKYNFILGGLFLSLAWLYKFNFLIVGIIPIIFCLPYRKIFISPKAGFKFILLFLLSYLIIPLFILWLKITKQCGLSYQFKLFEVFTASYWSNYGNALLWYVGEENFTYTYSLLAVLGIILAIFRMQGLLNRYIIGSTVSIFIYFLLFSQDLYANSFSQIPFLALVCIACSYGVVFISEQIKKYTKEDTLVYLMVFFFVLSLPQVKQANKRMFNTFFLGQDVAGQTLKELSQPDERIFLFTHPQGYAISRYAQRYMGWTNDLEDFKAKEKTFGIKLVCFYPVEQMTLLKQLNPSLFDYIQNNYHLKEIGLLENQDTPSYFILEKGKEEGRMLADFGGTISGQPTVRSIYRLSKNYLFFYTLRPGQ